MIESKMMALTSTSYPSSSRSSSSSIHFTCLRCPSGSPCISSAPPFLKFFNSTIPGPYLKKHPQILSSKPPRRRSFVTSSSTRAQMAATEEKPISQDRMLVFVPPHPLIKHWVSVLRNEQTPCPIFIECCKGTSHSCFPWKGICKVKVPKRVAFFLWTAAHGRTLTLDNLMLRGLLLVNRCCMYRRSAESVDHLLIHCPVAYSLWVHMLQAFGIHWVMPGSMESLVSCWSNWLGKFSSDIWNMVLGCLMWVVWLERNWQSFENLERTLEQLQTLSQNTLFDWARFWGSSNCSSVLEFLSSLRSAP